ncbi:metal ABC transporter substrate-binding protein [Ammonicoccus fulvus]|uniref:Metal ABC transporter substrate-binding protein n=1 Tax=Ammonicoccus fulvus TaxID=3138240 RepID=A0ABZ3FM65_9ACTN
MLRTLRRPALALAASALLLTTACGGGTESGPGAGAYDGLDVIVGFYPLQFVAESVGVGDVAVTNMTQPGAEAHDLELTPRQMAALGEADLVVHIKGFQPALDEAIVQAKPKNVLDVATVVDMHEINPDGSHAHEHTDEHADDEHAEPTTPTPAETHHAGDGHDHGDFDPHVWLDPTNMVKIAEATATALGQARPDEAAKFTANAASLTSELTTLDESFVAGLKTCERTEFVTSHAAFGYLADRYHLTEIGIRGLSPEAEPSPARVAEVQRLAREHGITTVFYETTVSPAVAEAIAGDLRLKTDVLDPLEGLSPEARGDNYLEVMNANLTALKAANGCS